MPLRSPVCALLPFFLVALGCGGDGDHRGQFRELSASATSERGTVIHLTDATIRRQISEIYDLAGEDASRSPMLYQRLEEEGHDPASDPNGEADAAIEITEIGASSGGELTTQVSAQFASNAVYASIVQAFVNEDGDLVGEPQAREFFVPKEQSFDLSFSTPISTRASRVRALTVAALEDGNGRFSITVASAALTRSGSSIASHRSHRTSARSIGSVAAGTLVAMADGGQQPIDALDASDQPVVRSANGETFEVLSVLRGISLKPLVRVSLANGDTVMLTANHAVPTNGSLKLASQLVPNDPLVTTRGTSTVTAVTPVTFSGEVYNLTLSAPATTTPVSFLANGVAVGDGATCFSALQQNLRTRTQPVPTVLPSEWQKDFQNAAQP